MMKKPDCCTLCDSRKRTNAGNFCGRTLRKLETDFDENTPAWCPLETTSRKQKADNNTQE